MKQKLLAFLIVATFCSSQAGAQLLSGDIRGKDSTQPKAEFGLKVGSHTQTISGAQWDHAYQTGIAGGFFLRMRKNKLSFRAEVQASTFHLSSPVLTDSMGNKGEFRATYFDVPVMLEYSFIPMLSVHAGGQYSNLVSLKSLTNISGDVKKLFKQGEFAILVGLEVKLPYNFSLGARYKYGLSDINNRDLSTYPDKWATSAIQAYVSYKIK